MYDQPLAVVKYRGDVVNKSMSPLSTANKPAFK